MALPYMTLANFQQGILAIALKRYIPFDPTVKLQVPFSLAILLPGVTLRNN